MTSILLEQFSFSGSSTLALFKKRPEFVDDYVQVSILLLGDRTLLKTQLNEAEFRQIADARVIVSTHWPVSVFPWQITIEAWHGFPIKAMGLMNKAEVQYKRVSPNYILSYSSTYNTFFNACTGFDINKYIITGMPRNDFLFDPEPKERLQLLVGKSVDKKRVVFYLPTFRTGYNLTDGVNFKERRNIFRFKNFLLERFINFINDFNILFVMKLHPVEEVFFEEEIRTMLSYSDGNIVILSDQMLMKYNFDLYEVLAASDLLITDYSSVYFDYLLLDKPILFAVPDIELYKNNRGFLVEPYDYWTPGPKAINQNELEEWILKLLEDKNYFKEQREWLKDIVHHYKDNNASKRVWEFILDIIKK